MALHLRSDNFSLRACNTHTVIVIFTEVRTSDLANNNNNYNADLFAETEGFLTAIQD